MTIEEEEEGYSDEDHHDGEASITHQGSNDDRDDEGSPCGDEPPPDD